MMSVAVHDESESAWTEKISQQSQIDWKVLEAMFDVETVSDESICRAHAV
jgi:hypothetical protein